MSEEILGAQWVARETRYADEVTTILRALLDALRDVDDRHAQAVVDARTAYTTAMYMRGGAEILTMGERRAATMIADAERERDQWKQAAEVAIQDRRRLLVVAYEAYALSLHIAEFETVVDEHSVDAVDRALMRAFDVDDLNHYQDVGARIVDQFGGIVALQEARHA